MFFSTILSIVYYIKSGYINNMSSDFIHSISVSDLFLLYHQPGLGDVVPGEGGVKAKLKSFAQ